MVYTVTHNPDYDLTDEQTLIERLRNGDQSVRAVLIERNIWVVYYAAKKYSNHINKFDDLVSIASLGLVNAMNSFDPSRGAKPSTYAICCIENEFKMYFRKNNKYHTEVSLDSELDVKNQSKQIFLKDLIRDESQNVWNTVQLRDICRQIQTIIKELPEREQTIINMRYGLDGHTDHTQNEVAEKLQVTQSCISKIENKIIKKIKARLKSFE